MALRRISSVKPRDDRPETGAALFLGRLLLEECQRGPTCIKHGVIPMPEAFSG
jgi:hypothetical protein